MSPDQVLLWNQPLYMGDMELEEACLEDSSSSW